MGRFKLGLLTGLSAGYVLGAKAGRERYDQIMAAWRRIKTSPSFQRTSGKIGAAVGLGIERGKVVALDSLSKASARVRNRDSAEL